MTSLCPRISNLEAEQRLTSHLLPCNMSSGKENNKPRLAMASKQQDNTLNKQSIAMLQPLLHSSSWQSRASL